MWRDYVWESQVRKLSKTLAMVGMLTPLGAGAVGVGEIRLHSALNQSLDAEIPLVLSPNENIADIQVRLAPLQAFEKAGINRHFFLTNIKFEPLVKGDGSVVIKLTSRDVVQEPYLNFLLEVGWPQGSMYREFTVLVDPPAAYEETFVPTRAAPVARARPTVMPRAPRTARPAVSAGDTITVVRNDTLWKIADRANRDRAVSQEQMMMALFEANPNAFYKDNVNALKAGATLSIPSREAILRRSARQAAAEYAEQNTAWAGRVESPAPARRETTAAEEVADGRLRLLAPTDAPAMESGVAPGTAPATGVKADLAMEMAETISQENEELRARVEELEQQLKALTRSLVVRDEQFAEIQDAARPVPEDEAPAGERIVDVDAGAPAPSEEAAAPGKPAVPEKPAAPAPAAPTKVPEKPRVTPAGDEGSSYLAIVGGVGLVLIGLLGWLLYRRRVEEAGDTESILTASSGYSDEPTVREEQLLVSAGRETNPPQSTAAGESSFLSEFTPSDFDAFETGQLEVDPISEADVYLAYGRYKQAEELIRHSMTSQPDRDDFKLKLLEIYYTNEDGKAFENYAKELIAAAKQKDEAFWEKVVEMGREICPNSSLFSSDPRGSSGQGTDEEGHRSEPEELDNLDLQKSESLAAPSTESPSEEEFDLSDEDRTLEFDFSSFEEPAGEDEKNLSAEDLAFDFSDSLEEKGESEKKEADEFRFDLDLDETGYDLDSTEGGDEGEGEEFASLTDMDEVETKLDLARAYVDMSDEESARAILEEVLEAGNEAQKKEAQELMEQLEK